jgi:hypothetical protein
MHNLDRGGRSAARLGQLYPCDNNSRYSLGVTQDTAKRKFSFRSWKSKLSAVQESSLHEFCYGFLTVTACNTYDNQTGSLIISYIGFRNYYYFFLIRIMWGGVQTGPTRSVGHFWPIVPAPGDCEDGKFGGIKIGRGNRSTQRKITPAPFRPAQIPLDQTRARTRAYPLLLTLFASVFLSILTCYRMTHRSRH